MGISTIDGQISGFGNLLLQGYGQVTGHGAVMQADQTASGFVPASINVSGSLTLNNMDLVFGLTTASSYNLTNGSVLQSFVQGWPDVTLSGKSVWLIFPGTGTSVNQSVGNLTSTDPNSLIGLGAIEAGAPTTASLTVHGGYFAGQILSGLNQPSGSLTKDGPGIFTLANDNSVGTTPAGSTPGYSQGTTVKPGTLLVTNTTGSATGTGAVDVKSGGSLGGSGIIAPTGTSTIMVSDGNGPATPHDLVVESGGKIDLDAFDPTQMPAAVINTLTIALHASDAATFQAGSSFVFDLGPSGVSDKVAFEDLTKNSAQVFFNDNQVSLDFLPGATDGTYTIFTFDQSDAYSGTLQDGSDFTFNYNPTSITVTVVPEPTIWSLMACGILLLLVRRFIVFAYRPESKGSH